MFLRILKRLHCSRNISKKKINKEYNKRLILIYKESSRQLTVAGDVVSFLFY